jgi:hypothetical protein
MESGAMRSILVTMIMLIILCPAVLPDSNYESGSLSMIWPEQEQIVEGNAYLFQWKQHGLKSVSIIAEGELTDIPRGRRGRFREIIADSVPAVWGKHSWSVPFLDTRRFRITVKGFAPSGLAVAREERTYLFRPAVLKNRTEDGIYIDVRSRHRQRLYVLRNNSLYRAYLTSGADSNDFYPRNIHPSRPHDHFGVFHIQWKTRKWYSRLFQVEMPWAMNYWNGHFIHATSPRYYRKLGSAASHGCNRLERSQARELYEMTPVGTRVEIIAR